MYDNVEKLRQHVRSLLTTAEFLTHDGTPVVVRGIAVVGENKEQTVWALKVNSKRFSDEYND